MLYSYDPEDSIEFYREQLSSSQNGYGGEVVVYKGKRYMPGMGLGSVLSSAFKWVAPLVKKGAMSLGKRALASGVEVMRDVAAGQNFSQSLKNNMREAGDTLLEDLGDEMVKKTASMKNPRKRKRTGASTGGSTRKRKKPMRGKGVEWRL